MTFKPLFGQITLLSLSLENFWVSNFHVSHLNHETFKLWLQNTLNMSKTTRVYFGVLHFSSIHFSLLLGKPFFVPGMLDSNCRHVSGDGNVGGCFLGMLKLGGFSLA